MIIGIGGTAIALNSKDPEFLRVAGERFRNFLLPSADDPITFDVETVTATDSDPDADLNVECRDGIWRLTRGDFEAIYDSAACRGSIRQNPNPYSIDTAIRVVHSLVLATREGLLLHAASAIRNGHAFLFAGESGAGKTTISRLAPADAELLTDEVSYIRKQDGRWVAWGTPFAGELGIPGRNICAPVKKLFFLRHGPRNHIEALSQAEALRLLLRDVLFFAKEPELVNGVFETAAALVAEVECCRLEFLPDQRVWETIA